MKILYVITQGEMGGAQLYVSTLAKAAKSQNWEVNAAIGENTDNWLSQEINTKNGQIWPLRYLKRAISPINDLMAIFELSNLYQKIKPDIIHLNSSKAGVIGALAFWLRPKSSRGKLIYTVHGWVFNEPINPLKKAMYYWLERLSAQAKSLIICVSDSDRRIGLEKNIAPAEKLITIHNGVDLPTDYFLDKKTALNELLGDKPSASHTLFIGTIANFYPTKGLNYLIEAIKILNKAPAAISYKLIIIGEGELREKLEQQIKRLKLEDNIILAGAKPEAAKYLKAFNLAAMSSVKEGFPYFILEAMSAGLPVIATAIGGIPEMIEDGITGYLYAPQSPEALTDKIKLLADEELRKKFGAAGLSKVKKDFSLEQMTTKTFSAYLK